MPLVVYKSSAGSGKTTTLVREYLKLTLEFPWKFRHVLAITFTNKAANEMKERVLESLEMLAEGKDYERKELRDLKNEMGFSDEQMKQKAARLLSVIIHDYDEFAISTIDSFVHGIIKTFATDVKLPQNFEVILDHDDIIPDVVQELYEKVGVDKDVTRVLLNFMLDNFEAEKGHDPTRDIYGFIEKQMKEEGFFYIRKLMHLNLSDFYGIIQKLEKEYYTLKNELKQTGEEALKLIDQAGVMPESFREGKGGVYTYFEKLSKLKKEGDAIPTKKPLKAFSADNWYSSKCKADQKILIDQIKDHLVHKFQHGQTVGVKFLSFGLLHRKIYDLALIREIRELFDAYTAENQKVHISEFNKKISETIAGQPVPFIYERLGRKYTHFLIDEFQDTSVLQWQNFLPLVVESLAYGNFNMLVGDAKQAIYRFRNGEVELFSHLPELYPAAQSSFETSAEKLLKDHYMEVVLEQNYRSHRQIVDFNNRFFEAVKKGKSDRIKQVYEAHTQVLPAEDEKQGGYIRIDLLEGEKVAEYRVNRLHQIRSNVQQLRQHNYRFYDICILTNTNDNAGEIASFLLSEGYPVVSSESLLLKSAPEVRMIMAFIRLKQMPTEPVHLAAFVHNALLIDPTIGIFNDVFHRAYDAMKKGLEAMLEAVGYRDIPSDEMDGLSVYELAEYLIEKFFGKENNNIFLHYFLDFIFENNQVGDGSTDAFLEYWDKKSDKAYIAMPEGKDAIRIMTIHKAKGLKFEAVMVDFIPMNKNKSRKEVWTELAMEELPELKVAIYPLVQELKEVGLGHFYEEEEEKTELDMLNMVYVAFTRPVSALYVVSNKKEGSGNKFTGYIDAFLQSESLSTGIGTFEWGRLDEKYSNDREDTPEVIELNGIHTTAWRGRIAVTSEQDDLWEQINVREARKYGNLVHKLLSGVKEATDVEFVVEKYRLSGLLSDHEANELKAILNKVVGQEELKPYFAQGVWVRNEAEMIMMEGSGYSFQRPDRVVMTEDSLVLIDYKTGAKEKTHKEQLNRYAGIFKDLGYRKIKKLLVYINDDVEVVKV